MLVNAYVFLDFTPMVTFNHGYIVFELVAGQVFGSCVLKVLFCKIV